MDDRRSELNLDCRQCILGRWCCGMCLEAGIGIGIGIGIIEV